MWLQHFHTKKKNVYNFIRITLLFFFPTNVPRYDYNIYYHFFFVFRFKRTHNCVSIRVNNTYDENDIIFLSIKHILTS